MKLPWLGVLTVVAFSGTLCPAYNSVYIENESNKDWRIELMQPSRDEGGSSPWSPALLLLSRWDDTSGHFIPQEFGANGSAVIPAKGRIALDTETPMETPNEAPGFVYRIRLFDETNHCDEATSLAYSVNWVYFQPSPNAPGGLRKRVNLGPIGTPLGGIYFNDSKTSVNIQADAWPR
jgi:hypothetical protein